MPLVFSIGRSFSQVFLVESPFAGLVIVAALALADWRAALLALLGASLPTVLSLRNPQKKTDALQGLAGFNGALLGSLIAGGYGVTIPAVVLTVLATAALVVVQDLFGRFFPSWLPVSTAPFCAVGTGLAAFLPAGAPPARDVGAGPLNAFSEVLLVDGPLPGLLIIVALALSAPHLAAYGMLGGVVGSGIGWACFGSVAASTGLWGYCGVLVALALGGLFLPDRGFAVRLAAAIGGAALSVGVRWGMLALGIPPLTWPFLIVMWAGIALDRARPTPA